MNDDWRLRIDLQENGLARGLAEMLERGELEHNLERAFHDSVIVSVDGSELFCYAGTREQAEAARELVLRLGAEHGWGPEIELKRWHPVAERWEDPDAPLGVGAAAAAEERDQRVADERAESAAEGYPEFEVRVQCRSRHEARELSQRLSDEDVPNIHRWSYVLIGATDEDSAQALADRVRAEVDEADAVTVELNRRFIYDNRPWSPFAVMGGLGG
ncbi:MAG: hypothetical protein ACRDNJ_18115 [Solirubrobacteraceae bacterium]